MFVRTTTVLFVCCMLFAVDANTHYGEKLVKLTALTEENLYRLKEFLTSHMIEIWTEHTDILEVKVIVPQEKCFVLQQFCHGHSISYVMVFESIHDEIQKHSLENLRTEDSRFNYEKYNRFSDIVKELHHLKALYPSMVRVCTVGHSYEGRPLLIVKVSQSIISCQKDVKPIVWVDSAMHGKEWISPATGMYMLKQMLTNYGNDTKITRLLNSNTVYFVPVFNPDGYEYTFTTDRLWRKTRTAFADSECRGADPNRNWNIKWEGSSNDPCSIQYRGIEPESEPCVNTYAKILRQKRKHLKIYFSLHSPKQLLLIPNAYTTKIVDDINKILPIARNFTASIQKRHGTDYLLAPAALITGPLSGTSMDYAYDKLNVTLSFTVELRDRGEFDFLLPPDQIRPSGEETLDAVVSSVLAIP